jgi:hypothetical protein
VGIFLFDFIDLIFRDVDPGEALAVGVDGATYKGY